MTEQEIIEGNRLIAEFMGGTTTTIDTCANYGQMQIPEWAFILYDFDTLKLGGYGYNTSWDWLMPVVEKIDGMRLDNHRYAVKIMHESCEISVPLRQGTQRLTISTSFWKSHPNKISAVYKSIIEFIQWYNNQSKQS